MQSQGRPVPESHRIAMIPASRMDFPVQRRWAASIFVLLQSWKLADVYNVYNASYPEQYDGVMLKWWIIDGLYLLALHFAKIPWLQFSVLKTLCLIVLMFWLDLMTFAVPILGTSAILFKGLLGDSFVKQTAVSRGKPINVKDVVFNSSHILGRHTLHILPHGTAKLNPNDEVYCLPSGEIGKKDIYIPIVLNNTTPHTVSIARHDFDTGLTTNNDYTGRDIQRATETGHASEGVEYYYVRVRHPGAYKLSQIVSKDGIDIRLENRQAYVFVCPQANFKPVKTTDYCTGDNEILQLQVKGVPPLNVEYTKVTGDNKQVNLKLDRIQPENFESPLQPRANGVRNLGPAFFEAKPDADYSWAAAQQINVDLSLTFDSASKQQYKLSRVVDGAGNEFDLTNTASETFEVHSRPIAKFACSQTEPVNLLVDQKSTQLPLSLEGHGPFDLEYTFSGAPDQTQKLKLKSKVDSIAVSSPGEYKLASISDKYCQGEVRFPSSCEVVQPQMPSVKVNATPIASECAGDNEVGMKFVAEFVGAPPYVLQYSVTKQTGRSKTVVERKREIIDRSRHIFSYLPSSSGEYIYEFTSLDDRYYKKRPTKVPPFKQTVHPQPDARFSPKRRSVHTCLGEQLSVDVELRGSGPFLLTWTVDEQKFANTVEGDQYTIQLPPFDISGRHIVSLVSIQDDNNCKKELEARDFTVDVRRDRPSAFFLTYDKPVRTVEITEGASAKLPIRLTGEAPWTVTYRNVEQGDRSKVTRRFSEPNAEIEVKQTGHYELLSVEDALCKGDVLEPKYLIQWLGKPTLSIVEDQVVSISNNLYERPAVCEGVSDTFDVEFSGEGPFYCLYKEYRTPTLGVRAHLLGSEEISTGTKRVRLPLKTREAGKYRYVFEKLADQRYSDPFSIDKLEVQQVVHAAPSVKFAKSRTDRTLCVGESLENGDMEPILLEFTGVAPFNVELVIRLQSDVETRVIKLDNIMTKKYKLQLPYELTSAGTYIIQLLSVNDANGCGSQITQNESIRVKALDIATITAVDVRDDICVGDNLEFSLSGMGPFTVQYLFNGKTEIAKAHNTKLSMIADKPGNMTIVSVGDQRNKCRSFPKNITKQIHQIPSSRVSGGKEIFENVQEGEMAQVTIDLMGTPPFDFEWRRYKLVWDHSNKRYYKGEALESHVVYGVQDHRHIINTSTEGVIELASIKDKYCQYPL